MANKRKYISTEYGMINLRDGDQIIHLDPEFLAELYWDLQDGKIAEVVRCKDCIYYGDHGDGEMACAMMILYPNKPTDYCSLGERREDAKTD